MQRVADIREQFKHKLANKEFVGNTVELVAATFLADEETIFGEMNYEWCERELAWYYTLSLNVNDIPEPIPAIWKQVSDADGFINSNYGWCIFSEENGNQYLEVLSKLNADRNSRQGQMIYTRPSMHKDWNVNGRKDFMCTAYNTFFIRDNKLVSHFNLRSNDAIFGYKGDRYWAKHVQNALAKDLGIEAGDLIWTASSLHVYDRHYHLVK